jgi:hypothetical protein
MVAYLRNPPQPSPKLLLSGDAVNAVLAGLVRAEGSDRTPVRLARIVELLGAEASMAAIHET